MPSASLREFVRIVRPSGKIVFAVVPEPWQACGYAGIFSEMQEAGCAFKPSKSRRTVSNDANDRARVLLRDLGDGSALN